MVIVIVTPPPCSLKITQESQYIYVFNNLPVLIYKVHYIFKIINIIFKILFYSCSCSIDVKSIDVAYSTMNKGKYNK